MLYYAMLFIIMIFLAYVVGITIVTIIDKHMSNISINLPKNSIVVNIPESFKSNSQNGDSDKETNKDSDKETEKKTDKEINEIDITEGFENIGIFHIIDETTPIQNIESICQLNHTHTNCTYGKMNYPNTSTMSPIDKRYFKYNYQSNLTLQDYINWLWLYEGSEEDLPYIHLKNLYKLKNGDILEYKKNILPPLIKTRTLNTADYFNKLYNSGNINLNCPLEESDTCYSGFNYNQYPNCK